MQRIRIHKGRKAVCPVCNPEAARKHQALLKKKKLLAKREESDSDEKRPDYRSRNTTR